MLDANVIIAQNISICLKQKEKKQSDLAAALDYTRQTVSKMLNGSRSINAVELKRIADFCGVAMETLVAIPKDPRAIPTAHAFMGKVKTDEARRGIEIADRICKMYAFYSRSIANASKGTERSDL